MRSKAQTIDFERLLTYNNRLYILNNLALREKLIKKYYNNLLINYFNIVKTYKLLIRKYH